MTPPPASDELLEANLVYCYAVQDFHSNKKPIPDACMSMRAMDHALSITNIIRLLSKLAIIYADNYPTELPGVLRLLKWRISSSVFVVPFLCAHLQESISFHFSDFNPTTAMNFDIIKYKCLTLAGLWLRSYLREMRVQLPPISAVLSGVDLVVAGCLYTGDMSYDEAVGYANGRVPANPGPVSRSNAQQQHPVGLKTYPMKCAALNHTR
jgi:hypothetical protein